MKESIIIGLIQNIAVLLTFAMIFENFWLKKENSARILPKIISGLFIGIIGIVIMYTPWTLVPGLVFDTRSIMLSISGLFFGPIPTLIAIAITTTMRFIIGGSGMLMGVSVIVTSGFTGLIWRKFRPNWKNNVYKELIMFGLTVHIIMLGCTLFLPSNTIIHTIKTIILPIFLIYTPGTLLLGLLLNRQEKNYQSRLAKEKLNETERNLSQILMSSNIVSIIIDTNGNILFCNQYLLNLTKYTREEVLKNSWFNFFVKPEQKEEIKNILTNNPTDNHFREQYENCIIDKYGNEYNVSWHNARLINSKNRFIGYVCIGVNITEQRKYEQELKNQIDKFTALNTEYLKQNRELIVAKDKAEESDRLKSAFLANLSHEIRTPMNAIMGFTELLRNNELELEKKEQFIDIIQNSGNHLLSIINDIVEISKIETKQVELKNKTIDIDKFINELYDTIKVTLPLDKKLEFSLIKANSTSKSKIIIDEIKLRQILINLLNNAIKFTEKGYVRFGYEMLSENHISFFVQDSGIGIEEKYHKVIFERFRQIELDTSRAKGGFGLGLAISKAYVELMGGTIGIKSEVGRGSKFTISLPINRAVDFLNEPEIIQAPSPVNLNSNWILVAEDDDVNYLFLKELLTLYRYQVVRAKTGKEAIEIFIASKDIKLVLMDIKMPEVNGYKALIEIKKINPRIPVIAQTAYALNDDIKRIEEAKFDDYVTKPINKDELIDKLQKILNKN
ncbi:hypothetical protein CYCD_27220 [Tenuifilaceae bacterium CYCD]|nr:hypothetical protein CYCD_27220 [Tenuifilaceae bacterium CYCD]